MNKLYCLLLALVLAAPLGVRAQQTDSLRLRLDQVFAPLDKSQVPTRLLADYAVPLAPLTSFDGSLADTTRTTSSLFRALYATAATACIYGANPLPDLPTYNAQVAAVEAGSQTIIPIMVQRVDYATLRPDALSQNLLSVQNNQLYDVAGRSQSPYQARTLFVAAPSREYTSSGTVTLVLPHSLYAEYLTTTSSLGLRTLEVDLADGNGYQPVSWDQPLTVSYATAGSKRIKVRFTYGALRGVVSQSAGSAPNIVRPPTASIAYESQFDLYVAKPVTSSANRPTGPSNRTLAQDSVFFAAQPGQAAGTIYIRYATADSSSKRLFKPLIVLEGYDKHFIAPHISPENYSLDKFLSEIGTTPMFNFRSALENVGSYDIVFVDYANGTDDILLNAGLFERVLNWVNTHKDPTSTEQNVVMGMSMGGLIGRYKLAQLEKANPGSTHVRLLVLQDSPQRGANFPLGFAAAVRQANNCFLSSISVKDLNVYIKEGIALLDQPGTRQLLKYQALGPNDSNFFENTFIDGPYRQMVSYAAPYRIVAVSQGSQCGVGLFPPYTELVRASASSFNGILGYLIQTSLPFIPGFGGEVIINALPVGNQSERVSELYLYTKIRILHYIPIRVTLTRQNFSCPAGLLPLDGVAGSTEPFTGGPDVLAGGSPGWLGPVFSLQYALQTRFSFVPTASALDIADFNLPALSGKYINNIASVSTSRTDGFLAQNQFQQNNSPYFNQPHLLFTPRNGEWMFAQMQNQPTRVDSVACSTECSPYADLLITGPAYTCIGQLATYTVPGLPPGTPIAWNVQGQGLVAASSTTAPTFTVNTSSRGQAIVQATFTDPCGHMTSTQLSVGAGNPLTIDVSSVSCGFEATANAPGFTGLEWQLNMDSPLADFEPTVFVPYSRGGAGTATLSGYNLCTNQYESVTVTRRGTACSNLSGPLVLVYPNPSADQVSVEVDDAAASQGSARPTASRAAGSTSTITLRLYDAYGQLKLEQQGPGPALPGISTAALPVGLYVAHVLVDGILIDQRQLQLTR